MRRIVAALVVSLPVALSACVGFASPGATPYQPIIPAFQSTTCDDLADELGVVGDAGLRSVVEGPDQIADEAKSVLVRKMQDLLVIAAAARARETGVIADCVMPDFLERAERSFSDQLRRSIGAAAYDANPVIDYQRWLLELSDQLIAQGMGTQ